MTIHSSATAHQETPHETETTIITVSDATKRRAKSVITDEMIDPQWREMIRYALESNHSWLAELVNRAEAGENVSDTFKSRPALNMDEGESTASKIEALAEIICRAGDEPTAALFVLMARLEVATQGTWLARAKHFALSRCAELNLYGLPEAQIDLVEGELLASNTLVS